MNDNAFLSLELESRSLSEKEIVMNFGDAIEAIEMLITKKVAVVGWEGWILYPDGRRGHSQSHQGTSAVIKNSTEDWTDFVNRSALFCKETIEKTQREWDVKPEVSEGTLYYCLTVDSEESA